MASIRPFQLSKYVKGEWLALNAQYYGVDNWEADINLKDDLLHSQKWKCQSNYYLEKHIGQHCNSFISMQTCTEHVSYKLPNARTHVTYLLDIIENNNLGLQDVMGQVRNDT